MGSPLREILLDPLQWWNFSAVAKSENWQQNGHQGVAGWLLVWQSISVPYKDCCMKSAEGRTRCCAYFPASASLSAVCEGPEEEDCCSVSHLPPEEGCGTNLSVGVHGSNTGGSHWWHTLPKINKSTFCLPYLLVFRYCKDSGLGHMS